MHTRQKLTTSEGRTCKVLGVARSTLHRKPVPKDDEALHLAMKRLAMKRLAKQYCRYGYRKITILLGMEGFVVNHREAEKTNNQVNHLSAER